MLQRFTILALFFGLICIAVLALVRIADPFFVRAVRETAFDQFQRLSPRPTGDAPVRVVDIDEASLRAYGQWPWPRSRLAELTERLGQMGAAAIAFDMLFAEPDRLSPATMLRDPAFTRLMPPREIQRLMSEIDDNDRAFSEMLSMTPSVLGFARVDAEEGGKPPVKTGFAYTGVDPAPALPKLPSVATNLWILDQAAAGIGSISLSPTESVSVVRKVPLLWTDGTDLFPSLAVEALRVASGVSTLLVNAVESEGTIVQSLRIGDFEIPTAPDGTVWVRFGIDDPGRYVSAADVLADEVDQAIVDRIAGNIVLVGTSAIGLYDIRATPIGENVPGVSVHAQFLEQVMASDYLIRSDWVGGVELAGFVLVAFFVLVMTMAAGPVVAFLSGGLAAGAIAIASWIAFQNYGVLLDPTFPMTGGFIIFLAATSFRFLVADRQKRQIRRAFSQYVAPAILDQIERQPETLVLGGETREVTVMFADIRDFTTLGEMLAPDDIIQFLNTLLGALSGEITSERGTIDKYLGDSVMAFWNAPVADPEHELHACRAALKMRSALVRFNRTDGQEQPQRWRKGLPDVRIGIGMATGLACVGNMGSQSRFDYSVVGDTVNVASRVETASKLIGFDIVLAASTAAGAKGLAFLEAGRIAVKGRHDLVSTHILLGDEQLAESACFRQLAQAHSALMDALRTGAADMREQLRICKDAAAEIPVPLEAFYERIPGRRQDFVQPVTPTTMVERADRVSG
ncbi:adenylate/guanylate cyclase domain-containing protein [Rhizobiales bacterium]|uniref:CHASE2 domain-containing protein n=1 Tax=Hongsoonwoonella zoysiae TaxID=2821844 RepID=UPI00155F8CF2|nr:adenylate/guanylate cyclase domain-containing protein [Hongsoonwoonella zoysiae]NRG19644.1 adenylate/guanylate cyclase domain-containing protein [Hongsoonwoonella zoysiae]